MMDYRMAYFVQTNLLCILLFGIILVVQKKHSKANTTETQFLNRLIYLTLAYCVADVLGWMCTGQDFLYASVFEMFFDTVYFALPILMSYVWLDYVYFRTDVPFFMETKKGRAIVAPLWIVCVLTLSTPVTKFAFYIDEDNVYYRTIGAYLAPIVCLVYMLYASFCLYRYVKKENNRMKTDELMPLMYFPLPILIAAVIQLFIYGMDLNGVGMTLSILLVFLNIQFSKISVDELTGLNNRRELKQYLHGVFNSSNTETIFLCMIDVDYFKSINDTYGHLEGDEALKTVANLLKKACGKQKQRVFLARYGGDEFVVSGVNYSGEELNAFEQLMKDSIEAYNATSEKPYNLTLSIGYSIGAPAEVGTVENLLKQADERMYDVKKLRKKA